MYDLKEKKNQLKKNQNSHKANKLETHILAAIEALRQSVGFCFVF